MNSSNLISNLKSKENKIKKDKLENVKSKYILQIIFCILNKKKLLEIIKYNKNIKERLNISIDDYKTYIEIYSLNEIEIIPVNNKFEEFIYIRDEEEKKYYHIYFNDEKEEIKRNYINKDEKIKIIKIKINNQIK